MRLLACWEVIIYQCTACWRALDSNKTIIGILTILGQIDPGGKPKLRDRVAIFN